MQKKLIKLLAKLEREYEEVPEDQPIKKERIFKKYKSLYQKNRSYLERNLNGERS